RLGHDVLLVDPIDAGRLDSEAGTLAGSANEAYFHDVTRQFGLANAVGFLQQSDIGNRLVLDQPETIGLSFSEIVAQASRADLLINMSGVLRDDRVLMAAPRRLYLDLDPAFTQLWHEAEGIDMGLDRHTHWATVGLAVGSP